MGIGAFTETMSRLDARKNIDLAHHDHTDKKIESVLHIMKIRLEGAAPLPLKLRLDDAELAGEFVLLEAMNIRSIGPNLELAPDADPSDGTLDVVLVSHDEKNRLSEYLERRIAGKKEHPRLDCHRVRHMRIESDETRVHIDDEVWPEHGEHPPFAPMIVDVAMHPEKLEILIPA
jgi:diacylglycerol kinase family enzyme